MLFEGVYQPQCQSDCHHAVVQRTSSITAHHGDFGPPQWSEPQTLQRPSFKWTTEILFRYPFQCDGWKATAITAADSSRPKQSSFIESDGGEWFAKHGAAVCKAKYQPQALSSLFSNCLVNNVHVFMGHNSAGFHWTVHFISSVVIKVLTTSRTRVKFHLTFSACGFVNFNGFWTLMVWHFDSGCLIQPMKLFWPF